jgi:hypothetical protein
MDQAICHLGYVPVRQERSHESAMISQILFGESYLILSDKSGWLHVRHTLDDTEGWISRHSVIAVSTQEASMPFRIACKQATGVRDTLSGESMKLPMGACWPTTSSGGQLLEEQGFMMESEADWQVPGPENADLEQLGRELLGVPGLQGGRCGFGCDGPGLVQLIGRIRGLALPRHCPGQAAACSPLNFLHEALPGDLAFFGNPDGSIEHVGMVLEEGRILHAWDRVRMDRLDQQGIYNARLGRYTHALRVIMRPGA